MDIRKERLPFIFLLFFTQYVVLFNTHILYLVPSLNANSKIVFNTTKSLSFSSMVCKVEKSNVDIWLPFLQELSSLIESITGLLF